MDVQRRNQDLAARPLPFLLVWGLPLILVTVANLADLSQSQVTMALVVAFLWMGTGCLVNARRCRRRHCYLAAPVLLAGAILTGLVGFKVLGLGPQGFTIVVWGTFATTLLTYVPEWIWGKYIAR